MGPSIDVAPDCPVKGFPMGRILRPHFSFCLDDNFFRMCYNMPRKNRRMENEEKSAPGLYSGVVYASVSLRQGRDTRADGSGSYAGFF